MTTLPKPGSPTTALSAKYDAWNRLVEVKQGETVLTTYQYDGLGRRIVRQAGGTYEHAFYTGSQVVETRNAASSSAQPETLQPKYQYVWSARAVDAAILRDANTDADGLCDDGRIYFLADANNNVTALADVNGDVQERYVYDPYGKATIHDAAWANTRTSSSYDNNNLYTGRELDPATGLYYYRARWYDPGTGQFTSRDPLGFSAGDANLLRYVHSNPASLTDPSGCSGGSSSTWDSGAGYGSSNDPSGLAPPSGFWNSLGNSWHSMQQTYTSLILTHWYGMGNEGQNVMNQAYQNGPLGQTQNSSGVYYYGTRGALGVATASAAAAAAVGTTEFVCLGNQSILEINVLSKGNVIKVISRPGQWGWRMDPAHHGQPWGHTKWWNW